jgi:hypothetical protein
MNEALSLPRYVVNPPEMHGHVDGVGDIKTPVG